MPGIGSPWMKLRTYSSASGPDGLLSFSTTRALVPARRRAFCVELGRGEAEAGDAVDLGEERRRARARRRPRHERVERRRFAVRTKSAAARVGAEERRVRLLRDLVEPLGQHAAEEPLDHALPVVADGRLSRAGIVLTRR